MFCSVLVLKDTLRWVQPKGEKSADAEGALSGRGYNFPPTRDLPALKGSPEDLDAEPPTVSVSQPSISPSHSYDDSAGFSEPPGFRAHARPRAHEPVF